MFRTIYGFKFIKLELISCGNYISILFKDRKLQVTGIMILKPHVNCHSPEEVYVETSQLHMEMKS